jgi:hypothetical protein
MDLVRPDRAMTFVCPKCGAVHDVSGEAPEWIGDVALGQHHPEGLIELGATGAHEGVSHKVVGRVRLAREGSLVGFDHWQLALDDGSLLWVRERAGEYALLVPETRASAPSLAKLESSEVGEPFVTGELTLTFVGSEPLRVVHVEGEELHLLRPGDVVFTAVFQAGREQWLAVYGEGGARLLKIRAMNDYGMWRLMGRDDLCAASDALATARWKASVRASWTKSVAMSFLLATALLASAAHSSSWLAFELDHGGVRVDFSGDNPRTGQVAEGFHVGGGLVTWILEGDCGLDGSSRQMRVILESERGDQHVVAECLQQGRRPDLVSFAHRFRVVDPAEYTVRVEHEGAPQHPGRAHLAWRLKLGLGAPWPMLYTAFITFFIGLVAFVLYPMTRRLGIPEAESTFERLRAELALAVRRRATPAPAPMREMSGEDV